MTNTAKKIENGHYEYRGYKIEKLQDYPEYDIGESLMQMVLSGNITHLLQSVIASTGWTLAPNTKT